MQFKSRLNRIALKSKRDLISPIITQRSVCTNTPPGELLHTISDVVVLQQANSYTFFCQVNSQCRQMWLVGVHVLWLVDYQIPYTFMCVSASSVY